MKNRVAYKKINVYETPPHWFAAGTQPLCPGMKPEQTLKLFQKIQSSNMRRALANEKLPSQ